MKWPLKWLLVVLTLVAVPGLAQSLEEQYVQIYNLMQAGDALAATDRREQALAKYLEAQTRLHGLQRINPVWNPRVVTFRLNYVAEKIAAIKPALPPPETKSAASSSSGPGETGALQRELAELRSQVGALRADKMILEAKLKEALATQPATVDPRELAKAERQAESLAKEVELLKVSLAQEKFRSAAGGDAKALQETKAALLEAAQQLDGQNRRASALAEENTALQKRLEDLSNENASLRQKANSTTVAADLVELALVKKSLEESNRQLAMQTDIARKLTEERDALQERVKTLATRVEAADALRQENELIKRQLVEARSASGNGDISRQLAESEARVAKLRSDAELLRLEKISLQGRIRTMSREAAAATPPAGSRPEDIERINQLQRERDDLLKQLAAASKGGTTGTASGDEARISRLSDEIAGLRARLEVFEARSVPYTAEELALFRMPSANVANRASDNRRPAGGLPAGSAELAIEAGRAFSRRDYSKAEENYQKILLKDEDNAYTLANLAATQLEQGKLDDAEANVRKALAAAPDDPFNLSILGLVKFRQDKMDDALEAFSKAAKLDPENAEIQNHLGVTLSHKGLRVPAETALRKAIQLEPGYAGAHNNLAVVYLNQDPPQVELARWHYQKARAAGYPRNLDLEKALEETDKK